MSIILKELRGSRYNYFAHLKCAGKILCGLMRELVYSKRIKPRVLATGTSKFNESQRQQ